MKTPLKYLLAILLVSLLLNLWGINWGLPGRWYPDERTQKAENMVSNLSLNPHYFAYGSFHYYSIMAFAVLPVKLPNQILYVLGYTQEKYLLYDYTTQENIVVILSRLLSALLGTGTVWLVYLLAKALFDYKTALLSASLLTVTMGFVSLSHFAITDIPQLFWFTLSCLMSSYVFMYGLPRWYLLSGLFSGFTAAVKYIGGLSLLTLISAHFLRNSRCNKTLILGILMALVGFMVANPVVIFSFFEFADGFVKESAFNAARAAHKPSAFLPLIYELKNALGIPLFLLCICGVLYSLLLLVSRECRPKILLVWSMIFPYYIIMGSMHVSVLRYIVPIVPFLLILTGKMMADLTDVKSRLLRATSVALFGIVISYSLIYTIVADLKFINDSRYLALNWIINNVRKGSRIEVTSYAPNIPSDRYVVIERPHKSNVDETALLIEDSSTYRFLQNIISGLESLIERAGLGKRETSYVAWYERAMQTYRSETATFDVSVKGLESRAPDYLIVSDLYFRRFSDDNSSVEGQFFDSLLSGRTHYKKVAEFKYRFLSWIEPQVDLVNPQIYIFSRDHG